MLKQVDSINYRIVKELGIIGKVDNETTELNLISYNNYKPKLDLRKWRTYEDGSKRLDRGLTLTNEEARKLKDFLEDYLSHLDKQYNEAVQIN